jgi:pyruvate kinase
MLREYIAAGMDGIRVFCDDGYETCKRLIECVRGAAREGSRRVVVMIELMCKLICLDLLNIYFPS